VWGGVSPPHGKFLNFTDEKVHFGGILELNL